MRMGLVVPLLAVIFLPWLARAQSGTDIALVIPLHPRVRTILYLPDAIDRAWVTDRNDFRVAIVGSRLYVRPRPGIPAGAEALLEVETRTIRRVFQLRVVARAGDAMEEVVMRSVTVVNGAEAGAAREALPVAPTAAEPAARAPSPEPSPGEPVTRRSGEPIARRATTSGLPRFDLSVHAVVALGTTALDLAGYDPLTGLQSHYALGLRLAGAPRGAWWALELEISSESLAGPLTYSETDDVPNLEVSGPWRRAMLGMRAQLGTRWISSAYAAIGAHVHLREIKDADRVDMSRSSTMKPGGVLALGTGLQYRTRDVVLGLDFQVRLGGPDEYRSIAALLAVGRILDEGE